MSETLVLRRTPALSGFAALLTAQALLQLLDLTTTFLALQAGAVEANPVSRAIIEGPGWWAYGGIKVLLAALFVALVPWTRGLRGGERRFIVASFLVFGVLMAGVVVNNALILL